MGSEYGIVQPGWWKSGQTDIENDWINIKRRISRVIFRSSWQKSNPFLVSSENEISNRWIEYYKDTIVTEIVMLMKRNKVQANNLV